MPPPLCDLPRLLVAARGAAAQCHELISVLQSAVPLSAGSRRRLCADPSCVNGLSALRSLQLDDCALVNSVSLLRDVLDACNIQRATFERVTISAGASGGLVLTLLALVLCILLLCAWLRRQRRKHPLQLPSPVRRGSSRTTYSTLELSRTESRQNGRA